MTQRKTLKREPTAKQKKAVELMLENAGKDKPEPIGAVLEKAGYKPGMTKNPQNVTRAQGFIELMDRIGATDDKLAQVLSDGLNAKAYIKTKRVEGVGKNRLKTEDIKEVEDTTTRHKYLETALRLKGLGRQDNTFNFNFVNTARDQYQ